MWIHYQDCSRSSQKIYLCIGSSAKRFKKGIHTSRKELDKFPDHHQRNVLKYVKQVEHIFPQFIPSKFISQCIDGIALNNSPTLKMPTRSTLQPRIYADVAFGNNVYLNCHCDKDFYLSSASVHARNITLNKILAYFCFPTLGIAIPLCACDQLLSVLSFLST